MITPNEWFKIGQVAGNIDQGCATCIIRFDADLLEMFGDEFNQVEFRNGVFKSHYGQYLEIAMKNEKPKSGKDL